MADAPFGALGLPQSQQNSQPTLSPNILAMILAQATGQLQPQQNWQNLLPVPGQRPAGQIQVIDPGMLWGGKDKNAVQPNDYMTNKYYGVSGENT